VLDFKDEVMVRRDYEQTLDLLSVDEKLFRAVVVPLKRLYKTNEREYPFNLVRVFNL